MICTTFQDQSVTSRVTGDGSSQFTLHVLSWILNFLFDNTSEKLEREPSPPLLRAVGVVSLDSAFLMSDDGPVTVNHSLESPMWNINNKLGGKTPGVGLYFYDEFLSTEETLEMVLWSTLLRSASWHVIWCFISLIVIVAVFLTSVEF